MNSKTLQPNLKAVGTSLWVIILSCSSASVAQANQAGREARQLNSLNAGEWRAPHQRRTETVLRSPESQTIDRVVPQNSRPNHLPGQVSLFRVTRPDSIRRSTYTNDAGVARSIHSGLSLDLSSTVATISVGSNLLGDSSVSINVGGSSKEIKSGSLVTAAEYAALNQKLSSGKQDLKLNDRGAAIDGSLNLNVVSDDGKRINTSAFVIPEGVSVSGDFGRHAEGIRVQNDLVNYGSLYATSSTRRGTAIIGARDIDNFAGGLITTDISKSVASTFGISRSKLDLAVRAERDLNNQGEISSSGSLELSAGRSINNSGRALATSSVSLNSATINNSGLVSSANSNLNLSAPTDANLTVNATGGEFLASNGNINVATTVGANPKTDSTILGGAWHANNLNISSGDGRIVADIDDTTAMVNLTGGSASFNSNGANLLLGTVDCSGDPLISSANSLVIGANQVTNGAPLAIIAGADISVANGVTTLDTSSATGGGAITIVGGANFTTNPGVTLTINGGTIGGGNVNLNGLTSITSSASSGNSDGGKITIIAFDAFGVGTVTIPTTLLSDGSGTGKGGDITVVGGHPTGVAVNMQGAISSASSGKGGNIFIAGAQTGTSPSVVIDASANPATQGAILSGNFVTGLPVGGSVNVNNSIVTNGGNVTVSSGGVVNLQAISASSNTTNTAAGIIDVSSQFDDINVSGNLLAAGNGTGAGGNISVSAPSGAVSVSGTTSSIGGATGKGGDITISAGGDIFAVNLLARGGTTSGSAGNISVQSSLANSLITLNSTTIYANSVVGAGGNITIAANGGRVLFQDSPLIISEGSTASGTVTLTGNGSTNGGIGSLTGKFLGIDTEGATTSGDIVLTTDSTHGLTLPGGKITFTAGRDVVLNLGSVGVTTGGAMADSGFVYMSAKRNIVGGSVAINTVPLTSGPGSKGGDVTLISGAAGSLTIGSIDTSSSGTNPNPGAINLTGGTGGTVLNGSLTALSAAQTGTINITANSTLLSVGQVDTAVFTITNSGSIITTSNVNVRSADFTSTAGSVNLGDNFGDTFTADIGVKLSALTNISQTADLTTNNLDISFQGFATSTFNVFAPSASGTSLQGNIPNGKLDLVMQNVAAPLTLDTNIQNLKVQAAGPINLHSATNVNALDLRTGNASTDISITGNIVANTNGTIRLEVIDSNIVETGVSGLQTSGTGSVNLVLHGTNANATLSGNNNINSLIASGSATNSVVTVNNGSNPITINGLSGSQSLIVSTTNAATGVVIGTGISTSGTLQFDTPRFFNDQNVSAASILIQNLNGDLALVGGAAPGGILSGSVPLAGTPGSPSNPTAINIVTMSGANLNLFGQMVFNGDVKLDNEFGTTTSNVGSQFDGNNNVILSTSTWNTSGSQITGNNFIFEESGNGNIVNSSGAINFNSNIIIKGHDVTFVALTDINITGPMTVNLSSDLGQGGTLTMLAGYEVTPATAGQEQNALSYTFTSTPSTGNINASNLTINTSATGAGNDGGDVVVIANGGTVQLGNIDATSALGVGGGVKIVGEKGVVVGDINNTGAGGSKGVIVVSGKPQIVNTPQLDNGTISGGSFDDDSFALTAFNISVGAINSSTILVKSAGVAGNSINLNGALSGTSIAINAGAGDLKLNFSNNLVVNSTSGFGGGIDLSAGKVIGNPLSPIMLTANGATRGGQVNLTLLGTDDITLGTNAGNFTITAQGAGSGGSVSVVTQRDITVNANGINTKGTNGDGASNSLTTQGAIVLNDLAILNVDGTGTNSDGGLIRLEANDTIAFSSGAVAPLVISANATGNGTGGTIIYKTADTAPVFIGIPTKTVKGTADFLNLSALGGTTGGDGGRIDFEVGGTLFVDPTKADASPRAGISSGASYKFKAGTTLVVNGPISANGLSGGDGGTVELESNSKTAFVVNNGGRLPKNGTSGPVTATGNNGDIRIRNFGGGISVKSSLTTDNIELLTRLKGGIVVSKGVILTGDNSIELQSDTGAIGKKALTVVTPLLQAISNSSVNLIDTFSGLVEVADSSAGKGGFTLTTTDDLLLNDITVIGGKILATGGNGGALTVNPTSQITAQDGPITINNPDAANGQINIFSQANIATSGKKGGNVIVAIGAVPKRGINTTPIPANFDTNPQGKGQVFFDGVANGVQVILGPDNNPIANAIDKNVIFSNLTTGAGLISVQVGVTITADPPIVEHHRNLMLSQTSLSERALTASSGSLPSSPLMPVAEAVGTFDASQVASINANLVSPNLVGSTSPTTLVNNVSLGATTSSTASRMNIGTASATTSLDEIRSAGANILSNGFANLIACDSVSTIEQSAELDAPAARTITDMFINAAFHGDLETMPAQFSISKNSDIVLQDRSDRSHQSTERKSFALTNGNILFAPRCDTTIETPHGTVSIKANALALVMQSHDRLSVFDIDDQSRNAISVSTNGKTFNLSPGQSVVVSSHRSERFEEINPIELVQYRRLNKTIATNGWKVFTSEFSIPSACFAVKPLRHLSSSTDKQTAKLRAHMLKTTAVLTMLRPDQGDYVQFFRPQVTAMSMASGINRSMPSP